MATKGTVKEFFIYLGLALTLNVFLTSLVYLCFNYIELFLPPVGDGGGYRGYTLDKIRWDLSVMVIVFPVLVFLSYLANKEIEGDSSKINTRSRTWFLYSVLFITSVSGVLDLVYLVNNFLNGDLAKTFLLKSLSVLVVATVAFVYYYRELHCYRHTDYVARKVQRVQKVFSSSVVAAMVAVLAFSFYTVGTPGSQRRQRQDENRLQTLVYLRNIVVSYYQKEANLPRDLQELNQKRLDSISVSKDPETGKNYEYRVIAPNTFELCGNFSTDRDPNEVGSLYGSGLSYKTGRNCFPHSVEAAEK